MGLLGKKDDTLEVYKEIADILTIQGSTTLIMPSDTKKEVLKAMMWMMMKSGGLVLLMN